ncbi:hypothetical protein AB0A70_24240 [Streptomyces morookaense]|uniref:hypothetical protein n=1 Tax=Streptomyces morookaense TaxID=1970 RepID=UPI0033CF6FF8
MRAGGCSGFPVQATAAPDLDRLDELDLRADIMVDSAGLQHIGQLHKFVSERFSRILRVMLEDPSGQPRHVAGSLSAIRALCGRPAADNGPSGAVAAVTHAPSAT